jgi:hypothetical protein
MECIYHYAIPRPWSRCWSGVAAIFWPMFPDFPMPTTTTLMPGA